MCLCSKNAKICSKCSKYSLKNAFMLNKKPNKLLRALLRNKIKFLTFKSIFYNNLISLTNYVNFYNIKLKNYHTESNN